MITLTFIIICAVAPLTFGVYLFHENIGIRLLWPYLLWANTSKLFPVSLCRMIIAVIIVFLGGCVVDYFRSKLFALIGKAFVKKAK